MEEFDLTSLTVEDGKLVGRYDVDASGAQIRLALAAELSGKETGREFQSKIDAIRFSLRQTLQLHSGQT